MWRQPKPPCPPPISDEIIVLIARLATENRTFGVPEVGPWIQPAATGAFNGHGRCSKA
ncbi:hypothetical protein [Kutzneria kofuensis]|uniref:hypothetical protein n=1 Tax=Kutzneria kofuensis TaxID=103725 RepID=UPI0031E8CC11